MEIEELELFRREEPDPIEELSRQMERGSQLTQASLQNAFRLLNVLQTVVGEMAEALATNGVIEPEQVPSVIEAYGASPAVAETKEAAGPPMVPEADDKGDQPVAFRWPGVVLRRENSTSPGEPVDCAARMHVCHAVCCALKFPLSASEVEAGKVKWDIGHPYMIRGTSRGYCCHNDAGTGGCRVYADRPAVCRDYSCAEDKRIWKDFDGMVLNTEWIAEHIDHTSDLHLSIHDEG